MAMQGSSGSMSPRGSGDMGQQLMSISSLVSSAGGGGVRGSIFTGPLTGTAAIGSSFAASAGSGVGWARACTGEPAETTPAWLDEDPAVALASLTLYASRGRCPAVVAVALSSSLHTTSGRSRAVPLVLSSS